MVLLSLFLLLLPLAVSATNHTMNSSMMASSSSTATATLATTVTAPQPPASTTPSESFWSENQWYLVAGGGTLLLVMAIVLFCLGRSGRCCCRKRKRRAKDAVQGFEALALAELGETQPRAAAAPTKAAKSSKKRRRWGSSGEGNGSGGGSGGRRESEGAREGWYARGGRRTALLDEWAIAHEDGYQPPASDVSTLLRHIQDVDIFKRIDLQDLQIMQNIGSGSFAEVRRGLYQEFEGQDPLLPVAIKMIDKDKDTPEARVKLLQEASIVGQFSHHKVQSLSGVVMDNAITFPMVVVEYLEKGPLDRFLRHTRVEPVVLSSMAADIAEGLHYLQCCSFVVGNLAARSVLVGHDYICKIAGFGLERDVTDPRNPAVLVHAPWAAPELLPHQDETLAAAWRRSGDSGVELPPGAVVESTAVGSASGVAGADATGAALRCFTHATDVWAFGIVLWELWSYGDMPYGKWSSHKIATAVKTGYRLPAPHACPNAAYRTIIDCWNPTADGRPSFAHIKAAMKALTSEAAAAEAVAAADLTELARRYVNDAANAHSVSAMTMSPTSRLNAAAGKTSVMPTAASAQHLSATAPVPSLAGTGMPNPRAADVTPLTSPVELGENSTDLTTLEMETQMEQSAKASDTRDGDVNVGGYEAAPFHATATAITGSGGVKVAGVTRVALASEALQPTALGVAQLILQRNGPPTDTLRSKASSCSQPDSAAFTQDSETSTRRPSDHSTAVGGHTSPLLLDSAQHYLTPPDVVDGALDRAKSLPKAARLRSLLPIAKESEDSYLTILPEEVAKTFPRVRPSSGTDGGVARGGDYMTLHDARLEMERAVSVSPTRRVTEPTAMSVALQGASHAASTANTAPTPAVPRLPLPPAPLSVNLNVNMPREATCSVVLSPRESPTPVRKVSTAVLSRGSSLDPSESASTGNPRLSFFSLQGGFTKPQGSGNATSDEGGSRSNAGGASGGMTPTASPVLALRRRPGAPASSLAPLSPHSTLQRRGSGGSNAAAAASGMSAGLAVSPVPSPAVSPVLSPLSPYGAGQGGSGTTASGGTGARRRLQRLSAVMVDDAAAGGHPIAIAQPHSQPHTHGHGHTHSHSRPTQQSYTQQPHAQQPHTRPGRFAWRSNSTDTADSLDVGALSEAERAAPGTELPAMEAAHGRRWLLQTRDDSHESAADDPPGSLGTSPRNSFAMLEETVPEGASSSSSSVQTALLGLRRASSDNSTLLAPPSARAPSPPPGVLPGAC